MRAHLLHEMRKSISLDLGTLCGPCMATAAKLVALILKYAWPISYGAPLLQIRLWSQDKSDAKFQESHAAGGTGPCSSRQPCSLNEKHCALVIASASYLYSQAHPRDATYPGSFMCGLGSLRKRA